MAAPMQRTRHPGIYRRGGRYVVTYRAHGRQHRESARTLDDARKLKSARQADVARGEFHAVSRVRFRDYAAEWIERHDVRATTRQDYLGNLERYAFPFFGERTLSQITPRDIANYIAGLRADGTASDAKVANALKPVSACLSAAVAEGLIRHHPGRDIPKRPRRNTQEVTGAQREHDEVRALTRKQLRTLLELVHHRHRLMFRFLAETGLRLSELLALQWQHLALDGSTLHVKVRRVYVRGHFYPPKTKHSRRDVPLDSTLVSELRAWRKAAEWHEGDDLVFPSAVGTPLQPSNLRRRVLAPVAEEVGVPWCGFHTFRHTCASMLFDRGDNAKKVQKWLGHHSAAFTLATYVHLLSDDLSAPLSVVGDNRVTTEGTSSYPAPPETISLSSAESGT